MWQFKNGDWRYSAEDIKQPEMQHHKKRKIHRKKVIECPASPQIV